MLAMDTMATAKTAKRPGATGKPTSLAEIGKQAAREAQRLALLASCVRHNWMLTLVAAELDLQTAGNVGRALKRLAPDEYKRAQDAGLVLQGRPT